jgi:hypothetical protein
LKTSLLLPNIEHQLRKAAIKFDSMTEKEDNLKFTIPINYNDDDEED